MQLASPTDIGDGSLQILLDNCADVNYAMNRKWTSLDAAVRHGHTTIVKVCTDLIWSIFDDKSFRCCLIMERIQIWRRKKALHPFIKRVSMDTRRSSKWTLFCLRPPLLTHLRVQDLVEHGAEVDAVGKDGQTPYHLAKGAGHLDTVEVRGRQDRQASTKSDFCF